MRARANQDWCKGRTELCAPQGTSRRARSRRQQHLHRVQQQLEPNCRCGSSYIDIYTEYSNNYKCNCRCSSRTLGIYAKTNASIKSNCRCDMSYTGKYPLSSNSFKSNF